MRTTLRRVRHSDAGLTLPELLVYCVLLGIVLIVAGTVFIRTIGAQGSVIDTGQRNTSTQVAVDAMERAVRNASVGGVKVSADGSTLITHTGGGNAVQWKCLSWFYVPPAAGESGGRLFSRTAATGTMTTVVAADFQAAVPSGWALAAEGVSLPSGTHLFTAVESGGMTTGVTVDLPSSRRVTGGSADTGVLRTTIMTRPQTKTSAGECF